MSVTMLEPWLTKAEIAEFFGCSKAWISLRMAEGMPHTHIAGRAKYRPSECEPWLESHGHIKRKGEAA